MAGGERSFECGVATQMWTKCGPPSTFGLLISDTLLWGDPKGVATCTRSPGTGHQSPKGSVIQCGSVRVIHTHFTALLPMACDPAYLRPHQYLSAAWTAKLPHIVQRSILPLAMSCVDAACDPTEHQCIPLRSSLITS